MNADLHYEVTNMCLSHEDDGTLHVAFIIYYRPSSSNRMESDAYRLDLHVMQCKANHAEIQHLVVSQAIHVPHEPLKRLELTNIDPLQEAISQREREILELVAQGLSNQEIARALILSVETVKRHLSNIFSKLHVHNRLQAVVQARLLGMLVEIVGSPSFPVVRSTRKEQQPFKNIL